MTDRAWLAAMFGIVVAAVTLVAIKFDINQVETGRETISAWCMNYAQGRPWFPFLISMFMTAVVCALATHLFLPAQECSRYMAAVMGMTSGVGVGAVVAMCFFLQR